MRLEVLANRRAAVARAAEEIARVLRRRGPRRLLLASGKTVVPIYDYERELSRAGVPDLALAGIGVNGHVAYLEPGRSLAPRAALVRLSASTRRGLAAGGIRPVPRDALTMGLESILSAREVLLVATGRRKAKAVAAALHGPVTPRCPASFLSLHPALTVILDRAAAQRL